MTNRHRGDRELPAWLLTIARRLAPAAHRDEAAHDLNERWRRRRATHGAVAAACRCIGDMASLAAFRISSIRRAAVSDAAGHARLPWRLGADMLNDFRYSVRLLARRPTFTALMLVTLTLGIASSTAVFTVADRVLLRPLPFPEPDRVIWTQSLGFAIVGGHFTISRRYLDTGVFAAAGIYASGGLNLGVGADATRVRAAVASSGFFRALNVAPERGRYFSPDDDAQASPPREAVISNALWRVRLGGRADVIGQTIDLNARSYSIIGVMPPGFEFPERSDVWILPAADQQLTGAAFAPRSVARLAPGVSMTDAERAIDRVNDEQKTRNPQMEFQRARLMPLQRQLAERSRPTLLLMSAVVGLLLLITAANTAGLMLSRIRGREQELAVRAAIGASRARIVSLIVSESAAYTAVAAAAGLLLASWLVRTLAAAAPAFAENVDVTAIDGRFAAVSIGVSALVCVLLAAAPAAAATRADAHDTLRASRTVADRGGWVRGLLVGGQVSASVVLLVVSSAAALMLLKVTAVDLGFAQQDAAVFELTLPFDRYPDGPQIAAAAAGLLRQLQMSPGVTSAGASTLAPGSAAVSVGIQLRELGHVDRPGEQRQFATLLSASPDYFSALGVRVVAGRAFNDADRAGAAPVAIVSESGARLLWGEPGRAIGRRLDTRLTQRETFQPEIVGVVADVRLRGISGPATTQLYVPLEQRPPLGAISVVVRSSLDAETLARTIRAAVAAVDPMLPPYNVTSVASIRARFLAAERVTAAVTVTFAIIAVALSMIGLYGVVLQTVTRRTREIGIRMALGANRSRVRFAVVASGIKLAGAGAIVGFAASWPAAKTLASIVPGMSAPPATVVLVLAVGVIVLAAAAAWWPARRASAVDPVVALRE